MIREIVRIDEDKCNGCGLCVPACAEGAIRIIDGKARLIADNLCDGLGACLGHCPQDAIIVEKRDAEEFDEAAVAEHLQEVGREHKSHRTPADAPPGGCPSVRVMSFASPEDQDGSCPSTRVQKVTEPSDTCEEVGSRQSQLRQWPVQLHLVPPTAPFLQEADILLAADCVPFAYADFHKDFLQNKALLIACPKLDDTSPYLAKLTAMINQSRITSLTVLHMEVPCCTGLVALARRAIEASGRDIPFKTVNISIRGGRKI